MEPDTGDVNKFLKNAQSRNRIDYMNGQQKSLSEIVYKTQYIKANKFHTFIQADL